MTIVILVTLLAAVLPAVSPNNEGRKIREASRMLVSLFAQAQAQAARDGRPVGVGFQDPWNDADGDNAIDPGELTGIALEAYIIAEPPPFTGFSSDAALRCETSPSAPPISNPFDPNEPRFVTFVFGRGVGGEGMIANDLTDGIPPGTFRPGDIVEVGKEVFELIDQDDDMEAETPAYLDPTTGYFAQQQILNARWINHRGRPYDLLPQGGKAYRIRRPPMVSFSPSRTAAETIQFPRGIGIDMDAVEGNRVIGVVFSPNGSLDAVYRDGIKQDIDEPVFILLGRVENGHPWTGVLPPGNDFEPEVYERYDFRGVPKDRSGDEILAERRTEVNVLNADSRWVTISPAGRVVSSENAIFDPRTLLQDPTNPPDLFLDNLAGSEIEQLRAQRQRYRDEAQRFARTLETEGGN